MGSLLPGVRALKSLVYVICCKAIIDLGTAVVFVRCGDWRHFLLFFGFAVADVGSALI